MRSACWEVRGEECMLGGEGGECWEVRSEEGWEVRVRSEECWEVRVGSAQR